MPVRGPAIGFCIDCDGHMRISTPEQNRAAAVEARNPLQWILPLPEVPYASASVLEVALTAGF